MLNYARIIIIDWSSSIITRLTRLTNINKAKNVNIEDKKIINVEVDK